ncbi:MAG: M14 family metallopeptidase [Calditrichia bacterium]
MRHFILAILTLPVFLLATDWTTHYERSGYSETSRYGETIKYCKRLANASPWVHYSSIGKSPQQRDIPLLILDKDGFKTAEQARAAGKAILLFQSAIHAGESDGKDASLMLMRDIAITKDYASLLDNTMLLFIPIFNVDGHERFGPHNRINQNGPKEMGYRSTAQLLNLNRDFLKAESPEMKAWLAMFNNWLPDFLVDNHVTDGADWQYALTYGVAKKQTMATPLADWTDSVLEPYLNEKMAADGYPIHPYFRLKNRSDITKGVIHYPFSPRFSTGYGAAQNRIFFLVECHALKNYQTRVTANYKLMTHMIELINREKDALLAANEAADVESAEVAIGESIALNVTVDMQDSTMIDFLGVDFDVQTSDLSGGQWVSYYSDKKKTMRLPHFEQTTVTDSAIMPYAYLVPQEWQEHISLLKRHGIKMSALSKPAELTVSRYLFNEISFQQRSFEGSIMTNFGLEPFEETVYYPAGTVVIITNQRSNRVIAGLLEPHAPDSFSKWGKWNRIFERREYAEDYFLEKMARRMIAEDPELKTEFEEAVAANPEQFPNHWAKLYFFYARSPFFEKDINVYPVGRLMDARRLPLEPTTEGN